MISGNGLNESAKATFESMWTRTQTLGIVANRMESGARVLDCGVSAAGGIEAGLRFAEVCLGGKASVSTTSGERDVWRGPWIEVQTDHPVQACMMGQYAGWPVNQGEKFFAMGSGPMRVKRGKEPLLESLQADDEDPSAVGTLECDALPDEALLESMAQACNVNVANMNIAVAPTRSIAGCVQVVARSVETSLHKLHELKFPLEQVRSGYGVAPLCPPAPDFALGIGRTNDAILYGGHVTLWVEGDDEQIADVGRKLPSCASRDFGRPFAEVFKDYGYDFYKVDPNLFSPAEVTIVNLRTGRSWLFGRLVPELIAQSFATQVVD